MWSRASSPRSATLADKAAAEQGAPRWIGTHNHPGLGQPQELRPEGRRQRRRQRWHRAQRPGRLEGPACAATTPTPAPLIPTRGCSGKSHNTAAIRAFQGHVLMENRWGWWSPRWSPTPTGQGERAAALAMLDIAAGLHPKTVAADKAYDTGIPTSGVPPAPDHAARIGGQRHAHRRQRHRWPHRRDILATPQPDDPQAHRGALRLGQDRRSHPPDGIPRAWSAWGSR